MTRVLIADPDPRLRTALAATLRAQGFDVRECARLPETPGLGGDWDVVLVDITQDAHRRTLLRLAASAEVPIVAMGAIEAVEALPLLRGGVADFVRKPFALETLERALCRARSQGRAALARPPLLTREPAVEKLVGLALAAAPSDATVWIRGETGTGKAALARVLHAHGPRAAGPFVAFDCASALPEELAQAVSPAGPFAAASGGTLCLEKVCELDDEAQGALVTALARAASQDVRLIATTRRDLVAGGSVRRELLHRLDVIRLVVPPLRERPRDIEPLARALLEQAAARQQAAPPELSTAALAVLEAHAFPGNVRELENLMQRAALVYAGRELDAARLLSPRLEAPPEPPRFEVETVNLKELERRAIARSLAAAGGNRTRASRALGISVRTLRNKLRQYRLGAEGTRQAERPSGSGHSS